MVIFNVFFQIKAADYASLTILDFFPDSETMYTKRYHFVAKFSYMFQFHHWVEREKFFRLELDKLVRPCCCKIMYFPRPLTKKTYLLFNRNISHDNLSFYEYSRLSFYSRRANEIYSYF